MCRFCSCTAAAFTYKLTCILLIYSTIRVHCVIQYSDILYLCIRFLSPRAGVGQSGTSGEQNSMVRVARSCNSYGYMLCVRAAGLAERRVRALRVARGPVVPAEHGAHRVPRARLRAARHRLRLAHARLACTHTHTHLKYFYSYIY